MKTLSELGTIILETFGPEAVERGYRIKPDDLAEIGRQALLVHDINPDGTLN